MVSAERTDDHGMPRIVYIAGYGRSGSTLLDCILGNHELMFGTGELTHLFQELILDARCSCLEPVRGCPVWQGVLKGTEAELGYRIDDAAARALTRRIERIGPFRGGVAALQRYLALWKAIYRALATVSGRNIIVDSSKNTRITWQRASILCNAGGLDLKAIHLVRDPRAVMYSVNRGHNDRLEEGAEKAVVGGFFRGLWGWTLSSFAVRAMKRRIGAERVLLVRYEDLVDHPFDEIARIGKYLGIPVDNLTARIRAEEPIDPGHGVSGNRMRRQGALKFRKDTEWERALPSYARLAAALVWPIAKRYGYRWRVSDSQSLAEVANG